MGVGVLAYAVPATATGNNNGSSKRHCDAKDERDKVSFNFDGQKTTPTGDAWVQLNNGARRPCTNDIVLSVYKVPDTWDGGEFPGGNNSAVPQHVLAHDFGTLDGHKKLYLHVPIQDCGNFQIDLYYAPKQDNVDASGTARFIGGFLFTMKNGQSTTHGQPGTCTPPVESSSPPVESSSPPVESSSPPVESSSPPVESSSPPVESSSPPVESSSPPVESSSPPVESSSPPVESSPPATTTAPPVTVAPTHSVPPIAAPIPVLPQSPPRLAETGSNSTIPLLGLGSLMLIAGIVLSLAGRRKPNATPAG
jgi:hypothetical protein